MTPQLVPKATTHPYNLCVNYTWLVKWLLMLGSTGNQLYRQPKHRQPVIQAAHAQRTTTHILFNLRNTYSKREIHIKVRILQQPKHRQPHRQCVPANFCRLMFCRANFQANWFGRPTGHHHGAQVYRSHNKMSIWARAPAAKKQQDVQPSLTFNWCLSHLSAWIA